MLAATLAVLLVGGISTGAGGSPALTRTTASSPSTLGSALPARMPRSQGKAVYVSLGGSDRNRGTIGSPFRTVRRAFAAARDGTTIYIRGGTYPDSVQIYNRKFSASNPVTLRSYPGETAKFTGNGIINMLFFVNDVGIRISRLDLSNQGDKIAGTQAAQYGAVGLKVYNSQHIELNHLFVHDNGNTLAGQGVLVSGGDGSCSYCAHDYDSDVQIWNSTFTNNGKAGSSQDHSIYFGGGMTPSGSGSVIANNVFYDQAAGYAIQLGNNADGVFVVNNTAYHTYGYQYGGAIEIFNSSSDGNETRNLKIYNNLMVDNNYGITGSGWVGMPSNFADNNYAAGTVKIAYNSGPDVQIFTMGSHNIVGPEPQFVDAGNHNFQLKAGSHALGVANPAYAPPLDADGKPRPAAPAVGAFG
jgi:hypothetical protein